MTRLVGCLTKAIYQWVYAQRVATLARELISLRTGRKARRGGRRPPPAPRTPGEGRGRLNSVG